MLNFPSSMLAVVFLLTAAPALAAADLIAYNGKIYSAEPSERLHQALAVEDGAVHAINSNDEIKKKVQGSKGLLAAAEAIDRETLFAAYTLNAVKVLQLSDTIGSLALGKQANFIVLDRDVFSVETDNLKDTRVLQTFFVGHEVYRAENL